MQRRVKSRNKSRTAAGGNGRDTVFIGGYVSKPLYDLFVKMAEAEERGNNSALLEKILTKGVIHPQAEAKV